MTQQVLSVTITSMTISLSSNAVPLGHHMMVTSTMPPPLMRLGDDPFAFILAVS